jgi:hypothetical protein
METGVASSSVDGVPVGSRTVLAGRKRAEDCVLDRPLS